jgi:hypothetical protein
LYGSSFRVVLLREGEKEFFEFVFGEGWLGAAFVAGDAVAEAAGDDFEAGSVEGA